ncbi:MAG TPA: flagellar brake protein [Accumulibacter sp.]|jgi:c-di-GMP-binding flagellar brake protein YcgR|nr:flagellar brake protein [Accumulibacter sp.]HQC80668.1 flagellar brake protein [Accumulibacter sp.]
MSQIAELSESEIEERYYITARTAIQFTLSALANSNSAFGVLFGTAPDDHFLTVLLAVDTTIGCLIVDCCGSEEINQRFVASRRAVFLARPGGIHMQFTTGAAREIDFQGGRAFAVPLPERIIRRQRRECFRIETPRAHPLRLEACVPGGRTLTFDLHDLSVAGVGLNATHGGHLEPCLETGLPVVACRLSLPGNKVDVRVQAVVRHFTALTLRSGVAGWRIGLRFAGMPHADEMRLQRYIVYREHEQHELI